MDLNFLTRITEDKIETIEIINPNKNIITYLFY